LLTEGDLARIAEHTGREDFHERRAPIALEYLEHDPSDPDWLELTVRSDGTRRVLRREADGDCTFLGEQGCVLPLEVRPLVCRLYPYSYGEKGLDGFDESYCPTWLLAPHGVPMADVIGVDEHDAVRWHATLYRELRHGTP
jgi:Fe-S-cluster containining protein